MRTPFIFLIAEEASRVIEAVFALLFLSKMPIMVLEVKTMRLFIAVNFDQETKKALHDMAEKLRVQALKGNFTREENFHLTLVFIGETSKVNLVKEAMGNLKASPFTLQMGSLGRFFRRGGDIYWVGVEKNQTLLLIYDQLFTALNNAGFELEKRPFKPHITLGREVVLMKEFNSQEFAHTMGHLSCEVTKISLMKSERIAGKLVYTEIYAKELS